MALRQRVVLQAHPFGDAPAILADVDFDSIYHAIMHNCGTARRGEPIRGQHNTTLWIAAEDGCRPHRQRRRRESCAWSDPGAVACSVADRAALRTSAGRVWRAAGGETVPLRGACGTASAAANRSV